MFCSSTHAASIWSSTVVIAPCYIITTVSPAAFELVMSLIVTGLTVSHGSCQKFRTSIIDTNLIVGTVGILVVMVILMLILRILILVLVLVLIMMLILVLVPVLMSVEVTVFVEVAMSVAVLVPMLVPVVMVVVVLVHLLVLVLSVSLGITLAVGPVQRDSVLEVVACDQGSVRELRKGRLDTALGGAIVGSLLGHDDLEALLALNTATDLIDQRLFKVSMWVLVLLISRATHIVGNTKTVDGSEDGPFNLSIKSLGLVPQKLQEADQSIRILESC